MAWMMDAYSARYGYTPGDRHRQARRARRLARPRRGDRPRRRLLPRGGGARPRHRPRRRDASPSRASATSAPGARELAPSSACKVVAVSDVQRRRRADPTGSTSRPLLGARPRARPLVERPGHATRSPTRSCSSSTCDVLVPGGARPGITRATPPRAGQARASRRRTTRSPRRPTTPPRARRRVIPDILANAGGVTVSYFEWAHEHPAVPLGRGAGEHRARKRMAAAWAAGARRARTRTAIPLRLAAFAIAIERVERAVDLRGYAA